MSRKTPLMKELGKLNPVNQKRLTYISRRRLTESFEQSRTALSVVAPPPLFWSWHTNF